MRKYLSYSETRHLYYIHGHKGVSVFYFKISQWRYCIQNIWGEKTCFLSQHTSFFDCRTSTGNGYLNLERQVGPVTVELCGSACNRRPALHFTRVKPAHPQTFAPSSDDKYKYQPPISIQDSKWILQHASKPFPVIWKHRGLYQTRLPMVYDSAQSVPALRQCTTHYCPSWLSGSVRLADVPPGPGGGGNKGDCWGVYWANLIWISGNVIYAFLTTSEIVTSALMP